MIALLAFAGAAFAACGGSTLSPTATASPATSATAVDACLVGTWTVVAQNENSPANDEQIAYSGGAGEVFTIDAQGGVTIDTHAAQPLVLTSAGQTFKGTVTGTGRGSLSTLPAGPNRVFSFTPSADDTRKTLSVDSTGTPLGPARPDTAFSAVYTCAPGRFTFYKSAVNYMVDGPIVTLRAGTGNPSSTVSPTPSSPASK
ncbi:MAG TPA: hypothetical protein VJ506_06285 [Candidatus Limnocylindrales bacterium]|nr:hypothetical protein [Candidatus Limnocylindrales bacterium]